MKDKFIIQQFNESGTTDEKPMQSFRNIAQLLNIDYHQVRQLYLHNKKNTKAHPFIKELAKQFKIIDNPDLKIKTVSF